MASDTSETCIATATLYLSHGHSLILPTFIRLLMTRWSPERCAAGSILAHHRHAPSCSMLGARALCLSSKFAQLALCSHMHSGACVIPLSLPVVT